MLDYSEFIEHILLKLNKSYKERQTYFLCQNPLTDDKNPSAQFFKDGFLKMYNATVEGKTSLSLKEVCKKLNMFDEFINWLFKIYNIPIHKLNKLRMTGKFDYKDLQQLITNEFISFEELKTGSYVQKQVILKNENKPKTQRELTEENLTVSELLEIEHYVLKRGLKQHDKLKPCKVNNNLALKIVYSDDFVKYRLINNTDLRYLSKGKNSEMFWVRKDLKRTLLLIEGAIEALTLSYYLNFDIAGLDNCLTAKTQYDLSIMYDKIICFIDRDQYKNSVKALKKQLPNKTYYLYKCKDKKEDFNSLHIKGMLQNVLNEGVQFKILKRLEV